MTDILPVLIIGVAFDLWPVVTLRVLVNASSYFDCLLTESGHCLVASYLIVTPAYKTTCVHISRRNSITKYFKSIFNG